MTTNQSNSWKDGDGFGLNYAEALRHDAHSSLQERIEDELDRARLIRKAILSMAPDNFSLGPEYTTLNRAHVCAMILTIVCAIAIRLSLTHFEPTFFSGFIDWMTSAILHCIMAISLQFVYFCKITNPRLIFCTSKGLYRASTYCFDMEVKKHVFDYAFAEVEPVWKKIYDCRNFMREYLSVDVKLETIIPLKWYAAVYYDGINGEPDATFSLEDEDCYDRFLRFLVALCVQYQISPEHVDILQAKIDAAHQSVES